MKSSNRVQRRRHPLSKWLWTIITRFILRQLTNGETLHKHARDVRLLAKYELEDV